MTTTEQNPELERVDRPDHRLNLKHLTPVLRSTEQYRALAAQLARWRTRANVQVLSDGVPLLVTALREDLNVPILVIIPRPEEASRLHERLKAWLDEPDDVLQFPETETLPFERLFTDRETVHDRVCSLDALLNSGTRRPVVVTSATAAAQRTLGRDVFERTTHNLAVGDVIDLNDTLESWRRMGYAFDSSVFSPGFVSRRGGIVDIFPVGADYPARVELWGDEVDSIRLFDPSTQRSTDTVQSIRIIPAHETLPGMTPREDLDRQMERVDASNCDAAQRERIREELSQLLEGNEVEDMNLYAGFFNVGSLTDYIPDDALIVQVRPGDVAAAAWDIEQRIHELRSTKEKRGELPLNFPSFHEDWNDVSRKLSRAASHLDVFHWGAEDLVYDDMHVLPIGTPPTFVGRVDGFVSEARDLVSDGHTVVAITSHSRRLNEILSEAGVDDTLAERLGGAPESGTLTVLQSSGPNFGDGFVLTTPQNRLIVVGDTEIFGVTKQRRTATRARANWSVFLSEISPGDYVVHVEHGVGRFVGVGRPSENGSTPGEYLILEYANKDRLYVPLEHLDRVTPYIAPTDAPPHLTRLGTQEWSRAKARAERSTRQMASELLDLYASREMVEGYPFGLDSEWQQELEESFPFEETHDQLTTLAEVKSDMEGEKPMDRLVCGDVGYGKTEIALRAAFKAVMNGKQVGVLVPTTVLAQQHYVTFSQRLSAFPITVEVLSRFRTDREQRDIVQALAEGRIDICIGTHRLIQKDVRFDDLGLVVIDEEQRFGVAHKERLKQMRREVDVLTLTATPIPRTLHMSLAGVRDMSTIETPPEERLPIKTYVSEFSDELIREAILRELDRQGQVFFLHNRVYNIAYMADYVRRIVPEATVAVAHGQMSEGELEKAMTAFSGGEFDVLVCTTIIESGLDIPNVNTLIVNRADSFGLAQLYQLRGRVGRSSRRAYSYLLVPRSQGITEAAERRLRAMLAATELGAGFRIAMRDLEIRGAGNILGAEQSGHILAIGFELYTRLLSLAVDEIRARRETGSLTDSANGALADALRESGLTDELTPDPGVAIDLGIPSGISSDYVSDLSTRLSLYQRLIRLEDASQIPPMEDELRDRFGPIPWDVQALLYTVRLRIASRRAGVESITREPERIVLRMKYEVGGARRALQRRLPKAAEVGNTQVRLGLDKLDGGWEEPLLELVERLAEFSEEVLGQIPEPASPANSPGSSISVSMRG